MGQLAAVSPRQTPVPRDQRPGFANGVGDCLCSVPHPSCPLTATVLELSAALGFHRHLGLPETPFSSSNDLAGTIQLGLMGS